MTKHFILRTLLFVAVISGITFSGCRKDAVKQAPTQVVQKAKIEYLGEQRITKNEFNSRTSTINGIDPNSIWTAIITQFVSIYRVTYPTKDLNGTPINASGLLVIPKTTSAVSLITFDNGTIFDPQQAPSLFNPSSQLHYWIPVIAALGSVVIVPDYLGYGITSNIPHPYQHAASLASATADLIVATKQILQDEKVNWNNKLFLAGYSEGGYAAMATLKLLQEQYAGTFKVTAASLGAGAYDITNTAKYFLSRNENRDSFYVRSHSWVLLTYNNIYHINRSLSNYFNSPYDAILANSPISTALLSVNPSVLINPAFKNGVLNGTDHEVLDVLAKNDIYDWKPTSPVLLTHAALDGYVPILNSEHAYASFKSKGANVEYQVIPDKNHPDAIPDFAIRTILYFLRF
jgi:pimeloyl-ACP methyl ester carboxylesterase